MVIDISCSYLLVKCQLLHQSSLGVNTNLVAAIEDSQADVITNAAAIAVNAADIAALESADTALDTRVTTLEYKAAYILQEDFISPRWNILRPGDLSEYTRYRWKNSSDTWETDTHVSYDPPSFDNYDDHPGTVVLTIGSPITGTWYNPHLSLDVDKLIRWGSITRVVRVWYVPAYTGFDSNYFQLRVGVSNDRDQTYDAVWVSNVTTLGYLAFYVNGSERYLTFFNSL